MNSEYVPPAFKELDTFAVNLLRKKIEGVLREAFSKSVGVGLGLESSMGYGVSFQMRESCKPMVQKVCDEYVKIIMSGENPPNSSFDIKAMSYNNGVGICVYYNPFILDEKK